MNGIPGMPNLESFTAGGPLDTSSASSANSGNMGGQVGGNVVFANSSIKDRMLAGFFGPPSYDRYATPATAGVVPNQVRVPGVGSISGAVLAFGAIALGVIGLGYFKRNKRG